MNKQLNTRTYQNLPHSGHTPLSLAKIHLGRAEAGAALGVDPRIGGLLVQCPGLRPSRGAPRQQVRDGAKSLLEFFHVIRLANIVPT